MAIFKGSAVAIVTPMKDQKVDFDTMGKLIDWQIEEGTDCIVVCGTTGEASTLYNEEHVQTIEYAVQKVADRVPVIAGCGSNHTEHGVWLSREAQRVGADGLLSVTPYYNKATPRGLIRHYTQIADSVDIPIILYSVSSRTGVNITPAIAKELSRHPNIQGIKEASGNISQIVEMARLVSEDFDLYCGNDDHVVPVLSVGGSGVISTIANIAPRDTHDMVAKFFAGDIRGAAEIQLKQKPLIDALFCEVNPVPVKTALSLMGKCRDEFRLPMCQAEESTVQRLKKEMTAYGIL